LPAFRLIDKGIEATLNFKMLVKEVSYAKWRDRFRKSRVDEERGGEIKRDGGRGSDKAST
jgi:hypothetical protein